MGFSARAFFLKKGVQAADLEDLVQRCALREERAAKKHQLTDKLRRVLADRELKDYLRREKGVRRRRPKRGYARAGDAWHRVGNKCAFAGERLVKTRTFVLARPCKDARDEGSVCPQADAWCSPGDDTDDWLRASRLRVRSTPATERAEAADVLDVDLFALPTVVMAAELANALEFAHMHNGTGKVLHEMYGEEWPKSWTVEQLDRLIAATQLGRGGGRKDKASINRSVALFVNKTCRAKTRLTAKIVAKARQRLAFFAFS